MEPQLAPKEDPEPASVSALDALRSRERWLTRRGEALGADVPGVGTSTAISTRAFRDGHTTPYGARLRSAPLTTRDARPAELGVVP